VLASSQHALELTTAVEILEILEASIHFDPPRMTVTAGFKAHERPDARTFEHVRSTLYPTHN
jgi:hypothetical protein